MNERPGIDRRAALRALAAVPLLAACRAGEAKKPMQARKKMPVLFLAHGAPMLLDDTQWVAELGAWAGALPRPTAVLMISAHWEAKPTTIGATRALPLIYDFYGFPDRFYRLEYEAPGAPALAERVRALLGGAGIAHRDDPARGLDHGAYVPLMCMYPGADVPVLQISMPTLRPADLLAVGKALAPLRDEGVLIVGSGFLTHNMREGFVRQTPAWASEFDAWSGDVLARGDVDALLDFESKGPAARIALPTTEHFAPVIVSAGAVAGGSDPVTFPITGFWNGGGFTRRSVQFG